MDNIESLEKRLNETREKYFQLREIRKTSEGGYKIPYEELHAAKSEFRKAGREFVKGLVQILKK